MNVDKLPPVKVLLIDHHARSARDLKQLLSNCGYDTRIANTADAALSLAKEFLPDFVLLDLGLPNGDSAVLGRQLKEACVRPCVVVGIGGQPRSMNANSIDCTLKKPFSFDALENILKQPRPSAEPAAVATNPDHLTEKALDVLRKSLKPTPAKLTAQEAQLLTELVKLPDARLASLVRMASDAG